MLHFAPFQSLAFGFSASGQCPVWTLGSSPQDRLYISVHGWPRMKHYNKTTFFFAAPSFVGPVWLPTDHTLLPLAIRRCARIRVAVHCVGYDRGVTCSARVGRSIDLSHVDRSRLLQRPTSIAILRTMRCRYYCRCPPSSTVARGAEARVCTLVFTPEHGAPWIDTVGWATTWKGMERIVQTVLSVPPHRCVIFQAGTLPADVRATRSIDSDR